MTDIDYDKMWKEIIEIRNARSRLLPGEKTIKMFMEETGMTEDSARAFLDKMIKDKKLRVRKIQVGSGRTNVYSPIIEDHLK